MPSILPIVNRTDGKPFIIAGPCSAETESQVMQTAKALAESGQVDYFRSGIWKPRTRPGSFEGVGKKGLAWLKRVKSETGLKTTTEVAKASHVYDCLKANIDMLWLGART
ncbi:MAG: 3-deoxy-7-phosphoheptulonate synthase, partial [Bacteroidota bacterium]